MSEVQVRSCGFIVFRDRVEPDHRQFLLMKHPSRWDLPKGHVDKGETQMECALRELEEETGIKAKQISIDPDFRYTQQYMVRYKRTKGKPQLKELVIYLATLKEEVEIQCTEHPDYQWWDWNPPHEIQAETIDPLLFAVANHLSSDGEDSIGVSGPD